jgi:hypothetical protein
VTAVWRAGVSVDAGEVGLFEFLPSVLFIFPTFTLDLRLGDIADSCLENVYIYFIQSVNCFSSMGEGDYSTNAWTYMLLVAFGLN